MRITITSNLSQNRTQEDSAFNVTAKFWDDASSPWSASTPTTVRYRVDCLTTGAQMLDWTDASAASSVTLSMTSTINAINEQWRPYEKREVTVRADNGLSTQYTDTYRWIVTNIGGVVD